MTSYAKPVDGLLNSITGMFLGLPSTKNEAMAENRELAVFQKITTPYPHSPTFSARKTFKYKIWYM